MFFFVLILITFGCSFADVAVKNACTPLPTQKNTSTILSDLRQQMQNEGIGIYVIFAADEHASEYTQPYDKRRDWITGFRGSAGTAVVSLREAALWTDSRYFTQAEEQLDCAHWLLMRTGNPGVPSLIDWIVSEANQTSMVRFHTQFYLLDECKVYLLATRYYDCIHYDIMVVIS